MDRRTRAVEALKFWRRQLKALDESQQLLEYRMAGPVTARKTGGIDEIADFRDKLSRGIVRFSFTRADNKIRHAVGTTSEEVIPTEVRRHLDPSYDKKVAECESDYRKPYTIWFWDLDKNEVKCFNTNRFEGFDPVNGFTETSEPVMSENESVGIVPRDTFYDDEDLREMSDWAGRRQKSLARALTHGTADPAFHKISFDIEEDKPTEKPALFIYIKSDIQQAPRLTYDVKNVCDFILRKTGLRVSRVYVEATAG